MKKFLAVFLSILLLITAMQLPAFAVSETETPSAKLSLDNVRTTTMVNNDGESLDVIGVDVNISENTDFMFAGRFLVVSEQNLTPLSYDEGTFASNEAAMLYTVTKNGSAVSELDKTGFQVLFDSDSDTFGINSQNGFLGSYYFIAPNECGEYSFKLIWLDGFNDGYDETDNVYRKILPYNITVEKDTAVYTSDKHIYDDLNDAQCNVCGFIREVHKHKYTDSYDRYCDICDLERTMPSATLSLENIREVVKDGVDTIALDLYVLENTSYFYTARFLILSNENLTPSFYDEGTFASDQSQFIYDASINGPKVTDLNKTGFQVLLSSENSQIGINSESGYLGTYYFEKPFGCETYSFNLVWLDGTNDGCDEETGEFKAVLQYDITTEPDSQEISLHVYDNDCDKDCNECGHMREVPDHIYDNELDEDCNICGYERIVYIIGDINGDKSVDTADLAYFKLYLVGARNLSEYELLSADIDRDKRVDTTDLARLMLYLAGASPL